RRYRPPGTWRGPGTRPPTRSRARSRSQSRTPWARRLRFRSSLGPLGAPASVLDPVPARTPYRPHDIAVRSPVRKTPGAGLGATSHRNLPDPPVVLRVRTPPGGLLYHDHPVVSTWTNVHLVCRAPIAYRSIHRMRAV